MHCGASSKLLPLNLFSTTALLFVVACGDGGTKEPLVDALVLTTSNLPNVELGENYLFKLKASGGIPPYRFQVKSGELPEGILLGALDGQLKGVPVTPGTHKFTIELSDSKDEVVSADFELYVIPEPLQILTSRLSSGRVDAVYESSLRGRGGIEPYQWSIAEGELPPGLNLSAEGDISGTPTAFGDYNFKVELKGTESSTQSGQLHIFIEALDPMIDPISLQHGRVGENYLAEFEATGGRPPLEWTLIGGELPDGLQLAVSGELTGIPTKDGEYPLAIQVEDGGGRKDTRSVNLRILAALRIETTALPQAIIDRPYRVELAASGGLPPYKWTVASSGLPAGLQLLEDGTIFGTVSTVDQRELTIQVEDSEGFKRSALYNIRVSDRYTYEVEPNLNFPPVCTGTTVSYAAVPIVVPDSMQIADVDVTVDVSYSGANNDLKMVLFSPEGAQTVFCGNGTGIPGGRRCSGNGGFQQSYDDQAGGVNRPARPLEAFNGLYGKGTWIFRVGVINPNCNDQGTIRKITLAIRADRNQESYVLVRGFHRNNLLYEPWVRIRGGGIVDNQILHLTATLYSVGANGYPEAGKGDDRASGMPMLWSWAGPPIAGASITPDGTVIPGGITGSSFLEVSGGGKVVRVPIHITPPEWNPDIRRF